MRDDVVAPCESAVVDGAAGDLAPLLDALRRNGVTDVSTAAIDRAMYSTDASLYRIPPRAVVRPRSADDVLGTLDACRAMGVPLTARGAGTSIAGNAIGPGVVLDTSRHLDRVLHVDAEARTATVQPGVVQARLQRAVAAHGLRFGPDPSTADRATIGGMIGNNACGSRALAYGRTSDNVVGLDVVTGSGRRLRLGEGSTDTVRGLEELVTGGLGVIRTELGRFGRQGSGYALEHLLPEKGARTERFLAGSEGTLALVLAATVRLVREPPHRVLVVLGYPGMATAADAVPAVLVHRPTACEGLDSRIVDPLRARPGRSVPLLPRGAGWLLVELSADTAGEALSRVPALVADAGALDSAVLTDPREVAAVWRIRQDGAGLAARTPDGRPAHSGWEDAAVPPERLGAYLREFDALLDEHGLTGLPYGHFGDGCLHVRLDLPLTADDGPERFARFLADAAALVTAHGGSLSGEHGDGRARSALLGAMYSPAALDLFARVKALFDPDGALNPGVLVAADDPVAALRLQAARPAPGRLALAYRHDDGGLTEAVHRCTGVGRCRADLPRGHDVMCPSFVATREEKDSTRGRARVLQELLSSDGVVEGWRAPEVHEALDLCLACKGCSRDCPTGVDMAAYKTEVLHQAYLRRLRPRTHYSLGWLPRWADVAARAPGLVNRALAAPRLGPVLLAAAGVDPRRSLPAFAPRTFTRWWQQRPRARAAPRPPVVLWVDTFTDHFSPGVGVAAVAVLEAAGYDVVVPPGSLCCGLTWITTGQLGAARRILGSTIAGLAAAAAGGAPVVGLEPSCLAVLRSEALELLPSDGPAAGLVAATRTLAELLTETPGWQPPSLRGTEVVAQPHCHHHAVLGWDVDAALLASAGAQVTRLGGCCGLAGSWGMERGHRDVSLAVAGQQLLPAVRAAGPDAVVLADGFSCRTQLADLTERRGTHLAQLLAARLHPPDGAGG